MPKPTFFNLPADKRERFVEEAVEEFARHPYDTASVSAIVERLGIAKGSVYQYFDGKRDLFQWLVMEAAQRRRAFLVANAPPPGTPFFDRLRIQYRLGMEEWQQAPLWSRIRLRTIEPTKDEALEAFRTDMRRLGHQYVRGLLEEGQREGAVRTDLDIGVTAHLVIGMLQQGLLDALLAEAGIDLAHLPDDPEAASKVPHESLVRIADIAVDLLARGIGTNPAPARQT